MALKMTDTTNTAERRVFDLIVTDPNLTAATEQEVIKVLGAGEAKLGESVTIRVDEAPFAIRLIGPQGEEWATVRHPLMLALLQGIAESLQKAVSG